MINKIASTLHPNGVKPNIGDTVPAKILGRSGTVTFAWSSCPDCSVERWVNKQQTLSCPSGLCRSCAAVRRNLVGEKNPRWNGGIRKSLGYNYITVPDDHPFIEMAGKVFIHGKYRYYIAEHRLAMATHLNRVLLPWELVHHINGIKDDNRIENLELIASKVQHLPSIYLQRRITELESRVTILEAENELLKALFAEGRDSVNPTTEFKAL